jgi:hypothetical protein
MTRRQSHDPLRLIDPSERERDFSEPASPVDSAVCGIRRVGAFIVPVKVVFLPIAIVAWALM